MYSILQSPSPLSLLSFPPTPPHSSYIITLGLHSTNEWAHHYFRSAFHKWVSISNISHFELDLFYSVLWFPGPFFFLHMT
jgi:hypothetical protein